MQRLDDAASHRKTLWIAFAVLGDLIVRAHGILDAVGLKVSRRRQNSGLGDAVRLHDPSAIGVVALLPACSFLQASSRKRAKMMMNVENFHAASLTRCKAQRAKSRRGERERLPLAPCHFLYAAYSSAMLWAGLPQ